VAAIGDLLIVCAIGFVLVAALSLMLAKTPATPPFARRAATSGSPQLRQDPNASFLYDRGFLFRRRIWFVGTCCPPLRIDAAHYGHFSAVQRQHPVAVARSGTRVWWWLEDSIYWESGSYTQRDVLALVRDRQRRAAQRMDRAHMMLNVDEGHQPRPQGQRQPIPVRSAAQSSNETAASAPNAAANLIFNTITSSRWPWVVPPQSATCSCSAESATASRVLTCKGVRPPSGPGNSVGTGIDPRIKRRAQECSKSSEAVRILVPPGRSQRIGPRKSHVVRRRCCLRSCSMAISLGRLRLSGL